MASMKYLVFRYADTDLERVYLFPEAEEHKAFATMFSEEWKAIRGGRVSVWAREDEVMFQVFGQAFSLGLEIDKEKDTALIRKQLEI